MTISRAFHKIIDFTEKELTFFLFGRKIAFNQSNVQIGKSSGRNGRAENLLNGARQDSVLL
jgi:hypothetical protein